MKFFEYLSISIYEIVYNKTRSLLTAFGIVIGIFSLIIVTTVLESAQEYILTEIEKVIPNNIIQVSTRYNAQKNEIYFPINYDTAKIIKRYGSEHIKAIAPYYRIETTITHMGRAERCTVISTSPEYLWVYEQKLNCGKYFSETDFYQANKNIVLGYDIAKKIFLDIEEAIGKQVLLFDNIFTVVGVLEKDGHSIFSPSLNNERAFIPITTLEKITGVKEDQLLMVKISDRVYMDYTIRYIQNLLIKQYGATESGGPKFYVRDNLNELDQIENINTGLSILLNGVVLVVLVVAAIGVVNTMLIVVIERNREIGLRKALGATNFDILVQFLLEAVILNLLAGLFGIVAGCLINLFIFKIANYFIKIEMFFSLWYIAILVIIILTMGLFSGIYPAWKAANLNPADTLNYE